jgi:formylglycine-generating enzyme required for sulfatase activity
MVYATPQQKFPFCIDATEVTRDAYAKFLATKPDPTPYATEQCFFNGDLFPNGLDACAGKWPPGANGSLPVVCVDWCDARAFCKWSKKRLCDQDKNQAYGEWTSGCNSLPWPYGLNYVAGRCNDANSKLFGEAPVGSFQCEGGYPGIFDLTGNVTEWTLRRPDADPTLALTVGGSYADNQFTASCTNNGGSAALYRKLSTRLPTLGFRCCADDPS